ncbi:MAG: hypothetical protein COA57_03040 [Flavobacteriales bacterium]|nr:MAG: hypothetical protein COA57_03040 [Flavobacteriales bacterium]
MKKYTFLFLVSVFIFHFPSSIFHASGQPMGVWNDPVTGGLIIGDAPASLEMLRVDLGGYLGIGAIPLGMLDVQGGKINDSLFIFSNDINIPYDSTIVFTSYGYLGIGLNNPARLLHVGGAMRFSSIAAPISPVAGDVYSDGTSLYHYDGTVWSNLSSPSSGGGWTDNGSDVVLSAIGDNVGIGISPTAAKLDVATAITGIPVVRIRHTFIGINQTALELETSSAGGGSGNLLKANSSLNGATAEFVVQNSGEIGLNVSDPLFKFHQIGGDHVVEDANISLRRAGFHRWNLIETSTNGLEFRQAFNDANVSQGITHMIIADDGNIGIGTTAPSVDLAFGGDLTRSIALERHTIANTAGSSLTLSAGGAASAATNQNGGDLLLRSGISTGTGVSGIQFGVYNGIAASTTDNALNTAMVIQGNGNVGIGTITPTSILHLLGSADPLQLTIENGGGNFKTGYTIKTALNEWFIGQESTSATGFRITDIDAASVRLQIDPGGNVGIGTIAPQNKLDVEGGAVIGSTYSGTNSAPSNGLLIEGIVGIGITSPASSGKLQVFKNDNANKYVVAGDASQTSITVDYQNVGVFGFGKGGNASWGYTTGVMGIGDQANSWKAIGIYAGLGAGPATIPASDAAFYSDAASLGYSGIFMNGNMGIGDFTPAAMFTVGSGDLFQVNSSGNIVKINNVTYSWPAAQGAAGQILQNNGSGTLTWATDAAGVTSVTASNGLTSSGGAAPDITLGGALSGATTITQGGNNMIFNLDGLGDFDIQDFGTSAFFVGDNGNVGIGTSIPAQKLQVIGKVAVNGNDVTARVYAEETVLGNKAVYGKQTALAGIAVLGSSTQSGEGVHGSSVTGIAGRFNLTGAGTEILLVEDNGVDVFVVDDGGNVGIGTTNPAYPLDVTGDARIGWHGSSTRIKILPSDFMGSASGTDKMLQITNSSPFGVRPNLCTTCPFYYAFVPIPEGYKAIDILINGNNANAIIVYDANLSTGIYTQQGASGTVGTVFDFPDFNSTATNCLVLYINTGVAGDIFFGGYVTIAKIP